MSGLENLNQLINEIGSFMGLAGVFEVKPGAEWQFVLAEGFALTVEYEASDDRVTITGDITDLGPQPPRDLLIMMLQYNIASTETGGVRLALDENLRAVQIYDMPAATLTLDTFKNTVLGLADKIVAWQGALNGRLDAPAPAAIGQPTPDSEFIIKV